MNFRKILLARLLLLFLVVIFPVICNAQKVLLLDSNDINEAGKFLYQLEDSFQNYTINEVLKKNDFFSPSQTEVPVFTNSSSAFWLRLYVKNNSTTEQYYLIFDNPLIDDFELYTIQDGESVFLTKMGIKHPFQDRLTDINNFVYPVLLPKGEVTVFYFRITSVSNFIVPVKLCTNNGFVKNITKANIFYGILYGTLCFAILLNLFIYLNVFDKSYFLYICSLVTYLLYAANQKGHLFQYILPEHPEIIAYTSILIANIASIIQVFFIQTFLRSKKQSPKLHIVGYFLQSTYVVSILLYFSFPLISVYILTGMGFVLYAYAIIIGISVYRVGYRAARFYLTAIIAKAFFILCGILIYFGYFPYTFITSFITDIGVVSEAILFSMALGDRYFIYKIELEDAQRKLNKELELKLKEREEANRKQSRINDKLLTTKNKLMVMNKNLMNTNKTLDSFVYTASHDLKAPIANMQGLIRILKESDPKSDKENPETINLLDISIKKLGVAIKDLEVIHEITSINATDIKTNHLDEIIEEFKTKYQEKIDKSGASIETDFSEVSSVRFSEKNLRTIIFQMLSNSIKFRSRERKLRIYLCTKQSANYILLSIQDNGMGIPKGQQHKIWGMFKKYDPKSSGPGIGLYLVRNILDNANGRIMVKSQLNEGTVFNIFFKK